MGWQALMRRALWDMKPLGQVGRKEVSMRQCSLEKLRTGESSKEQVQAIGEPSWGLPVPLSLAVQRKNLFCEKNTSIHWRNLYKKVQLVEASLGNIGDLGNGPTKS